MKRDESEGEKTPTGSKPKTIFILRDFAQTEIEEMLEQAQGLPNYRVEAPGLGTKEEQGLVFRNYVRERIDEADRVIAYVDLANANVAFEIGFAVGKGARLVLARNREAMPSLLNVAPFAGSYISLAGDVNALESLFASDKAYPPIAQPKTGSEVLFLCPQSGNGIGYRDHATQELRWRILDRDGWAFDKLPELLDGVGRVVWLITPLAETEGGRDHPQTCAAAVVAGYAEAVGIHLDIFCSPHHRELTDVADRRRVFESVGQLYSWLGELGSSSSDQDSNTDELAVYRRDLQNRHRRLVPFFPGIGDRALSEVYVELEIQREGLGSEPGIAREKRLDAENLTRRQKLSLRELLTLAPGEGDDPLVTGRWVLLGEPGAGKSTACRHLCRELAREGDGPIPVFVSLVRWQKEKSHPFRIAAEDASRSGSVAVPGLVDRLREEAEKPNRVWLLLDGLDEVREGEREEVRRRLEALLGEFPRCRVVVTSRPAGHEQLGGFRYARLQPLDLEARRQLLCKWLPGNGPVVWERLQEIPTLFELARNPLMLTLIAKLSEAEKSLPRTRIQLYQKAIDLLLRRGFGEEKKGVVSTISAEALLAPLSLRLHEKGGESWSMEELDSALDAVLEKNRGLEKKFTRTWPSNDHFLEDVGFNSGVLAPAGGREQPWSFLHRSLREYLAAVALSRLRKKHYLKIASGLKGNAERIARWGETFALLCGLVKGPGAVLRLLNQIRKAEPELALRALPHVEDFSAREALDFLWDTEGWDGDHLGMLAAGWRSSGTSQEEIKGLLMSRMTPKISTKISTETLAFLYYGLEKAGVEVNREAFFRSCDRWPEGGPEVPGVVPIPPEKEGNSFLMGSPDGVGDDSERPQHHVTLTPYRMARTAVTEEQFTRFDRSRPSSGERLPVVDVSWWESWLYCRWVGGFLPTEAQWEFACRAGKQTRWWTGDDEKRLGIAAWYDENSDLELHPVANKEANPWGLYDVHGNVWEWCADWDGSYDGREQTDPGGPAGGSNRVIRGGSAWNDAGRCRSAYRVMRHPDSRNGIVGFRVALPAAPSS